MTPSEKASFLASVGEFVEKTRPKGLTPKSASRRAQELRAAAWREQAILDRTDAILRRILPDDEDDSPPPPSIDEVLNYSSPRIPTRRTRIQPKMAGTNIDQNTPSRRTRNRTSTHVTKLSKASSNVEERKNNDDRFDGSSPVVDSVGRDTWSSLGVIEDNGLRLQS